jgi:hypothetical protein|tara:strand:- start:261 stop:458 length:198 start_codon:yes stop_codon:yes gene_type:complete
MVFENNLGEFISTLVSVRGIQGFLFSVGILFWYFPELFFKGKKIDDEVTKDRESFFEEVGFKISM